MMMAIAIWSCQKEDEFPIRKGKVAFDLATFEGEPASGRSEVDRPVAFILITLQDESGALVMDKEKIDLIRVGEHYVTRQLELVVGNYEITEFFVMDSASQAVYIAPLTGSEKAEFVASPLPIPVVVVPDGIVSVPVEVVAVHDRDDPASFGLVDFGIDFGDPMLVQLSIEKHGQPSPGRINIIGMRDGFEIYSLPHDVPSGGKQVRLYDNLDSIVFILESPAIDTIARAVDELQSSPKVHFTVGSTSNVLRVQVDSAPLAFIESTLYLQSEDDVYEHPLKRDPAGMGLIAEIKGLPEGDYAFAIAVYEESIVESDSLSGRGFIFRGVELLGGLQVNSDTTVLELQGPGSTSSSSEEWSERYFQRLNDPAINARPIVWSVPTAPCTFDFHFLPVKFDRQPEYAYVDYFLHTVGEESKAVGYVECHGPCHLNELLADFNAQLKLGEGSNGYCVAKDWELADSMMILDFGDGLNEFVVFFMRWDTQGPALLLDAGRAMDIKGRMAHRSAWAN